MEVIVKNEATARQCASRHPSWWRHMSLLNQPVEVREEQGRIVIESVRRKTYMLVELLGSITAINQHKPVDTGAPVGKEVW